MPEVRTEEITPKHAPRQHVNQIVLQEGSQYGNGLRSARDVAAGHTAMSHARQNFEHVRVSYPYVCARGEGVGREEGDGEAHNDDAADGCEARPRREEGRQEETNGEEKQGISQGHAQHFQSNAGAEDGENARGMEEEELIEAHLEQDAIQSTSEQAERCRKAHIREEACKRGTRQGGVSRDRGSWNQGYRGGRTTDVQGGEQWIPLRDGFKGLPGMEDIHARVERLAREAGYERCVSRHGRSMPSSRTFSADDVSVTIWPCRR